MTYMSGKFAGLLNNLSYQEDELEGIPEIEMGNILTNIPDLNDLLGEMPDFEVNQTDVLTLDNIVEDESSFPVMENAFETEAVKTDTNTGFKEIFSNIISIFN